MKPLRRAAARLRDAGSIPVLAAALLAFAVSVPLAAQEHSRPHDSSDMDRGAEPRSEPESWTSYSPPSSDDSVGSAGNGWSPSDDSGSVSGGVGDSGSVDDDSGTSSDDSSDGQEPRFAIAQKDYSEGRSAQPRSDSGSRPSSPPSSGGGDSGGSNSGGWSGPSSSGQPPRTAEPRSGSDDSSHRQRPRTGSRDDWRGGDGGWYGHGGYYGGHYGGYYSPYHRYYYWGPYFGWGWWGWWPGDGYYGYWGYNQPRYYGDRYDRYGRTTAGALDVDVSPGKTEVWIDGRYVGTADDFDGFPQYLWLDKGVYDLALYRDGYKTIARQITIHAGTVMSVDDRMQRGESVKPQDLVTKTHERRDERIRSEEERREEIARRERDNMEDWRDRARRRMEERGDRGDRYEQRGDEDRDADGAGRLRVEILPADASVYLDGRFVGTGVDLERLRQGLRVEPGEHRISVVRPGHKGEEQEFTVAPGQEVELEIELESME